MDEEIKPVKKRPVALLLVIAAVCIAGFVGITLIQMRSNIVDYNYTLMMTAKGMNLACPYMVSDAVRLDSVVAKYDKQLWQYYTIVNTAKEDIANETYCEDYEENVAKELRKQATLSDFGRHDVTLFIELRDKNGEKLCTVDLPASKYYDPGQN